MDQIEEVITRGIANIIPGKNELKEHLASGKKLNIYLGIDPTAHHIHLGHALPLRKLQAFVELGHHVTMLIGDFTALIGDTSDKESERPILTSEEIESNFQTYKKQAGKILDFSKVTIHNNREWLEKLTYKDIIKLQQQFSLNDFISRELIKKRLDDGKRIRLDEILYPMMQGYDSYYLNTDIQIGGTDQTFNMQSGRTLIKNWLDKDSFVLATEFLMGTDGRKMSKSWGNAIWLDDSAEDMYTKIMAINDDLIIPYYTLATNMPLVEIKEIEQELKKGKHPMHSKKQLALQIVTEFHSVKSAQNAQETFEKTVQKKELPDEIDETILKNDTSLLDALVTLKFAESKAEAKRLIEQGGVSVNENKVTNLDSVIEEGILRVGKRRFIKVTLEK